MAPAAPISTGTGTIPPYFSNDLPRPDFFFNLVRIDLARNLASQK